ncbi:hypothetical protein [Streptomyces sp. SID10815]|uniref:hypothetical protein n=1 Tax=Streptomyces sp. SID10815 TaxID=2706027 RepID=UPI0013CD24FD|nr:hypothetical protein [Streptomyces sp. SID10815]NEA49385.1 hypothetical protein [Streptomyces sp. SID10815]
MSDFRPQRNVRLPWGIGGSLAAAVFVTAVSGCGSDDQNDDRSDGGRPAASAPASATASRKAAPAPAHKAAPATLLTLTGSGTKTTGAFETGGDWTLSYTFDCAKAMGAVDGKGNFIVFDRDDRLVNEMDRTGKADTRQHSSGTRRLQIVSECDWTVKVTG